MADNPEDGFPWTPEGTAALLERGEDWPFGIERSEMSDPAEMDRLRHRVRTLEDQRKELDRRIHNQRVANRENWEIVEMRRNAMGSPASRAAYVRLVRWFKEERGLRKRYAAALDRITKHPKCHRLIMAIACEALERRERDGDSR